MLDRNEILNGKQNLWEITEVAVYDAHHGLEGLPSGAVFQLHEWAPEPAQGSEEPYTLWVESDRTPLRIAFTQQQVEAFSRPTRSERLAMKAMILDCLRRLATGDETLVWIAGGSVPCGRP